MLQHTFTIYTWVIHNIIVIVLAVLFGRTLAESYMLESRARRLFALSVKYVEQTPDSYTERPYPSGNIEYNEEEVHGFSAFLEAKKIAVVRQEGGDCRLLFSMGVSPLAKYSEEEISYFATSKDGSTSVFISAKDYHQYKRKYSFDQLCSAVAKLFKRFFNEYKAHNEKRILTELGIK